MPNFSSTVLLLICTTLVYLKSLNIFCFLCSRSLPERSWAFFSDESEQFLGSSNVTERIKKVTYKSLTHGVSEITKIHTVSLLVSGSFVRRNKNNECSQTDSILFTCRRDRKTSRVWSLTEARGQLVTRPGYPCFHSSSDSISGKNSGSCYLTLVLTSHSSCYSCKERRIKRK